MSKWLIGLICFSLFLLPLEATEYNVSFLVDNKATLQFDFISDVSCIYYFNGAAYIHFAHSCVNFNDYIVIEGQIKRSPVFGYYIEVISLEVQ